MRVHGYCEKCLRVHGYCEKCHRIRMVTVKIATSNGVLVGICDECAEKGR